MTIKRVHIKDAYCEKIKWRCDGSIEIVMERWNDTANRVDQYIIHTDLYGATSIVTKLKHAFIEIRRSLVGLIQEFTHGWEE